MTTGNFVDKTIAKHVDTAVAKYLKDHLDSAVAAAIDRLLPSKMAASPEVLSVSNVYLPNRKIVGQAPGSYMGACHPMGRDFLHPEFEAFIMAYQKELPPQHIHRKIWEFAFVYHHLCAAGVVQPGARGVAFGVGNERLPALFASMGAEITASDAIVDVHGWADTGQYSNSREQLFFPDIVSRDIFDKRVQYVGCDMNNIDKELTGYNFCWSSCALEHLGSIRNGLDFIINSVEKTLKIGGVAVHTTELNLTSDIDTLETESCVLYRKSDLEGLCSELEARGHSVSPMRYEPGDLPLDYFVDVPPYAHNPHLKLMLASYVTTSVGIVVQRGR